MAYYKLELYNLTDRQRQSIEQLIDLKPRTIDLVARKDGETFEHEADWIKNLRLIEED